MKKVIALMLALVLCMSMGVTAFAAGWQSPTDPTIPEYNVGFGTDKDGNKLTVVETAELSKEVEEILKDDNKVKDILTEAGYILKGDEDVLVLGAGNISLAGQTVPEGGVDLELRLDTANVEVSSLKDGDALYVLHQKADGTWEVLEGKVVIKNGLYYVSAHFDSLSPVAIIKVMSDGKVVVLENNKKVGEVNPKTGKVTKVTTVKTSPKTGA